MNNVLHFTNSTLTRLHTQDAAWMLNPSSPLKCTSPSDVYLYLKSSDFVGHDLDPEMVFDGCVDQEDSDGPSYELELVLKKWYPIDRSREFRCFVRDDILVGELPTSRLAWLLDCDCHKVFRNMPTRHEFLRTSHQGRNPLSHTRNRIRISQR